MIDNKVQEDVKLNTNLLKSSMNVILYLEFEWKIQNWWDIFIYHEYPFSKAFMKGIDRKKND